jgi:hypothetical protein
MADSLLRNYVLLGSVVDVDKSLRTRATGVRQMSKEETRLCMIKIFRPDEVRTGVKVERRGDVFVAMRKDGEICCEAPDLASLYRILPSALEAIHLASGDRVHVELEEGWTVVKTVERQG